MNLTGLPNGWWISYQFDEAVIKFGLWVEGKLSEYNKDGKPKHRLTDLLREHQNAFTNPHAMFHPGVEIIDVDDGD